jgi:hypothetical protein
MKTIIVWYLLITPLPTGTSPYARDYKTIEVESAEFPTEADCKQFASQMAQQKLDEKYPPSQHPAIVGATTCFSREKRDIPK